MLVEPHIREAKCGTCSKQWALMQTSFYCSCGHVFTANDVENAITTTALIKQRLIQQLQSMDMSEKKIQQTYQNSLVKWLDDISFEIGNLLGSTAASIKNWIDSL